jgi:hypothetical protein
VLIKIHDIESKDYELVVGSGLDKSIKAYYTGNRNLRKSLDGDNEEVPEI